MAPAPDQPPTPPAIPGQESTSVPGPVALAMQPLGLHSVGLFEQHGHDVTYDSGCVINTHGIIGLNLAMSNNLKITRHAAPGLFQAFGGGTSRSIGTCLCIEPNTKIPVLLSVLTGKDADQILVLSRRGLSRIKLTMVAREDGCYWYTEAGDCIQITLHDPADGSAMILGLLSKRPDPRPPPVYASPDSLAMPPAAGQRGPARYHREGYQRPHQGESAIKRQDHLAVAQGSSAPRQAAPPPRYYAPFGSGGWPQPLPLRPPGVYGPMGAHASTSAASEARQATGLAPQHQPPASDHILRLHRHTVWRPRVWYSLGCPPGWPLRTPPGPRVTQPEFDLSIGALRIQPTRRCRERAVAAAIATAEAVDLTPLPSARVRRTTREQPGSGHIRPPDHTVLRASATTVEDLEFPNATLTQHSVNVALHARWHRLSPLWAADPRQRRALQALVRACSQCHLTARGDYHSGPHGVPSTCPLVATIWEVDSADCKDHEIPNGDKGTLWIGSGTGGLLHTTWWPTGEAYGFTYWLISAALLFPITVVVCDPGSANVACYPFAESIGIQIRPRAVLRKAHAAEAGIRTVRQTNLDACDVFPLLHQFGAMSPMHWVPLLSALRNLAGGYDSPWAELTGLRPTGLGGHPHPNLTTAARTRIMAERARARTEAWTRTCAHLTAWKPLLEGLPVQVQTPDRWHGKRAQWLWDTVAQTATPDDDEVVLTAAGLVARWRVWVPLVPAGPSPQVSAPPQAAHDSARPIHGERVVFMDDSDESDQDAGHAMGGVHSPTHSAQIGPPIYQAPVEPEPLDRDMHQRYRVADGTIYVASFADPAGHHHPHVHKSAANRALVGGLQAYQGDIDASRRLHIQEKWIATGSVTRAPYAQPGWRLIRTVWAKPKQKERDGKIIWDARICPNGSMVPVEESGPSSAPTSPALVINAVLAWCAWHSGDITIHDVKGAFYASDFDLYDPEVPVCFKIPPQSPDYDPTCKSAVWLINRAVPGLREAPLAWHDSLARRLAPKMGKTIDASVWRIGVPVAHPTGQLVVHVDDLLASTTRGHPPKDVDEALREYVLNTQLTTVTGGIKAKYLGLRLSREAYLHPILAHLDPTFIMDMTTLVRVMRNIIGMWHHDPPDTLLTEQEESNYLSLQGKIGWATSKVAPWRRPFYASSPRRDLRRADFTTMVKWMETEGSTWPPVIYPASPIPVPHPVPNGALYPRLETYSDVSNSAVHCLIGLIQIIRWSPTDYAMIGWSSRAPQRCISSNGGEMEAILTAANFGQYVMEILTDLRLLPFVDATAAVPRRTTPCIVYTDNLGAQQIHHGTSNTAAKHGWISRTIAWVREVIDRGELLVYYLPRAENSADFLTKSLSELDWLTALNSIALHPVKIDALITFITKKNGSLISGAREGHCSGPSGTCTVNECSCWPYSNGQHSRRPDAPMDSTIPHRRSARPPMQRAPKKADTKEDDPVKPPKPISYKRRRVDEDDYQQGPPPGE